jgi:hypothetical protein
VPAVVIARLSGPVTGRPPEATLVVTGLGRRTRRGRSEAALVVARLDRRTRRRGPEATLVVARLDRRTRRGRSEAALVVARLGRRTRRRGPEAALVVGGVGGRGGVGALVVSGVDGRPGDRAAGGDSGGGDNGDHACPQAAGRPARSHGRLLGCFVLLIRFHGSIVARSRGQRLSDHGRSTDGPPSSLPWATSHPTVNASRPRLSDKLDTYTITGCRVTGFAR